MVVVSIEEVSPSVTLCLCQGCESADQLLNEYPFLSEYKDYVYSQYLSLRRRYEVLAELLLIHRLFGNGGSLSHDSRGCPYLSNGYNIGISHTKGCVAVIVSPSHKVSVDVEYMSERVNRVADRFLRKDETAVTLTDKLIHWCAKETLYKLYPDDNLGFMDIQLQSILEEKTSSNLCKKRHTEAENSVTSCGTITVENLKRHKTLFLSYRVFSSLIITYGGFC